VTCERGRTKRPASSSPGKEVSVLHRDRRRTKKERSSSSIKKRKKNIVPTEKKDVGVPGGKREKYDISEEREEKERVFFPKGRCESFA